VASSVAKAAVVAVAISVAKADLTNATTAMVVMATATKQIFIFPRRPMAVFFLLEGKIIMQFY